MVLLLLLLCMLLYRNLLQTSSSPAHLVFKVQLFRCRTPLWDEQLGDLCKRQQKKRWLQFAQPLAPLIPQC